MIGQIYFSYFVKMKYSLNIIIDDVYQKYVSLYYKDYCNNIITLKSCDTKSCQESWIICAIEINGQLVAY